MPLAITSVLNSNQLCSSIDATFSTSLGKFVNDSSKPNSKMNIVLIDGKPHLLLFALIDIQPDTELRYNYGATKLWWRRKYPQYNKPFNLNVSFRAFLACVIVFFKIGLHT